MTQRRRTAPDKEPSWRLHPPTPIMISPRMRWLLILTGVIALIFLVRAAPSILSIVLGGFALALVLSFPVRTLSRFLPRGFAILITFLALFGLPALALFALIPTLLLSGVTGAVNVIFTAFGMLFVSVYLLSDTRKLTAAYLKVAPHRYRSDAAVLWGEFGFSLSRYVAGLFAVPTASGCVASVIVPEESSLTPAP